MKEKNNKYEEAIPLIKKAMEEGNIRAYFLSYILDGLDIANIKIKDEEVINIIGDNSFASDTFETILLSIIRDNEDTFYAKLEIIKTYAYSGDFIAMVCLLFSNSDDLIDSEIISMIELCDNAILYYWLGNFFYEKNDNINAIKYYKKSYKLGIYSAVRCLLDLNGINEEEIINPNILYHLGKSYYNEIEYDLAVKWFIKAVEQGNDDALKMLTHMLHNNKIIDDDTLVVKWNRIIAENGDTCAQYKLGYCYCFGDGVEKDYVQAVEWYRKAAEQGYAKAQYELGDCYYYGTGVGEDYVQAVEWYKKAAEQGNADAQKQLVYMYENGYGVSPDKITAEDWYCKARENYKPSFSFDMADLLNVV